MAPERCRATAPDLARAVRALHWGHAIPMISSILSDPSRPSSLPMQRGHRGAPECQIPLETFYERVAVFTQKPFPFRSQYLSPNGFRSHPVSELVIDGTGNFRAVFHEVAECELARR
jgi:hypothetical protein